MSDNPATSLNYPYGNPSLSGIIKQQPEDFIVNEELGFSLNGSGEHLFLYIQKKQLTTAQLIDEISKVVGVPARQIGYSGLKDKQAITRQWVSIQLPGAKQMPEIPDTENYQVLESGWNDKKLRVGVHKRNSFEITIRELKGQSDNLQEVVQKIKDHGFANYFGEQRFGRQQDNVSQALAVLGHRHKLKRLSRNKKSIFISALRSELFNQILNSRIQQNLWMAPVNGDVFMLAGSQSIFSEALSDEIHKRYIEQDIHSALSLAGSGESKITLDAKEIEDTVLSLNPEISQLLNDLEVKRSVRANRSQVSDFSIQLNEDATSLVVKVALEKGVYLTSLLQHFIQTQSS